MFFLLLLFHSWVYGNVVGHTIHIFRFLATILSPCRFCLCALRRVFYVICNFRGILNKTDSKCMHGWLSFQKMNVFYIYCIANYQDFKWIRIQTALGWTRRRVKFCYLKEKSLPFLHIGIFRLVKKSIILSKKIK